MADNRQEQDNARRLALAKNSERQQPSPQGTGTINNAKIAARNTMASRGKPVEQQAAKTLTDSRSSLQDKGEAVGAVAGKRIAQYFTGGVGGKAGEFAGRFLGRNKLIIYGCVGCGCLILAVMALIPIMLLTVGCTVLDLC